MSHPLTADEVHVQMKYGLPAMGAGIDNDAVPALVNVLLCRDLTPDHEHVTDQGFVPDL